MKSFQEIVSEFTDEYLSKNGFVTCEFSTNEKHLFEKQTTLKDASYHLSIIGARWVMYQCHTCQMYDQDMSIHVSIEALRDYPINDAIIFDGAIENIKL